MKKFTSAAAIAVLAVFAASQASAGLINPGYDLFQSTTGTTVPFPSGTQPFEGVPLGTFNFGGTIGVKNVGLTDTIVQRMGPPLADPGGIVPVEMLALQLHSVMPFDPDGPGGAPFAPYFITLHSVVYQSRSYCKREQN